MQQSITCHRARFYSGYGYNNDYDSYGSPTQFGNGSGTGWGGVERKSLPRNTVSLYSSVRQHKILAYN